MQELSQDLLKNSPFKVSPAPQYCTSETLLGSLYRAIGYKSIGEKSVYSHGKRFFEFMHGNFNKKNKEINTDSTILKNPEKLNALLEDVFVSPKSENGAESQKKTYVDTPLTPAFAIFSGTNNYSEKSNPWNPGELVKSMIIAGTCSFDDAKELWSKLFIALNVDVDDFGEDLSARFIEKELRNWFSLFRTKQNKDDEFFPSFSYNELDENKDKSYSLKLSEEDYKKINYPAKQFTKDLKVLLDLKNKLSRKLWISLLESVLRLSTVAHFLWICNIRYKLYSLMVKNLEGEDGTTLEKIDNAISLYGESFTFAEANGKAVLGNIKGIIRDSLLFSIYLDFWGKKLIDTKLLDEKTNIETIEDFNKLLSLLFNNRNNLYRNSQKNKEDFQKIKKDSSKVINCIKGKGKSRFEFARHILGKKMPKEARMQGYDQSYIINKKGTYSSSPWIISFGDTSILAFAYCALGEQQTSKPILVLEKYLKAYGIKFESNNKLYRQLSEQLRLNSLVLDTPDASSTMNLIPPFSV